MDIILNYNLLKSFHIIFLLRGWQVFFIYQEFTFIIPKEKVNTSSYKTFIVMERKLLKYIMNPSFVLTFLTGFILIIKIGEVQEKWFISKFLLVLSMAAFHIYCAKLRKDFEAKINVKTEKNSLE